MKKVLSMITVLSIILSFNCVCVHGTIQTEYDQILDQYVTDYGDEGLRYTLFDIDNNGIDELIVETGGSNGSFAYGYISGSVIYYGPCADNVKGYYQKDNNLYVLGSTLEDIEDQYILFELWIDKLVLENNQISHQNIYNNPYFEVPINDIGKNTEKNISQVADFLNGARDVEFFNIQDRSLLNESSQITVVLNNTEIGFDQSPIMQDDRVMVPIRAIFEEMGFAVEWDQIAKSAVASRGDDKIEIQVDNPVIKYNINGVYGEYNCDVDPMIISDRTLVPVRAVAECAGCEVSWDADSRTVFIIFDNNAYVDASHDIIES